MRADAACRMDIGTRVLHTRFDGRFGVRTVLLANVSLKALFLKHHTIDHTEILAVEIYDTLAGGIFSIVHGTTSCRVKRSIFIIGFLTELSSGFARFTEIRFADIMKEKR